jgi:hypothetical protein
MRVTAFALAAAALLTASAALADDEATHAVAATAARGSARRVVIDLPAGEVEVRNGDAATITVKGEIRRRYDSRHQRDKAQRIADDISLVVSVNGTDATVKRKFGPDADSWSARSHHTNVRAVVTVPVGMDIELTTHFGEVRLDGSFGNIDIDLRAGEIDLRTPRANVKDLKASVMIGEVHTDLGDFTEEHEGVFPGRTHWVNSKGGRSHVDVHTTVGEINVTLVR